MSSVVEKMLCSVSEMKMVQDKKEVIINVFIVLLSFNRVHGHEFSHGKMSILKSSGTATMIRA